MNIFVILQVLDKTVPQCIKNSPFMFMHQINMKDNRTQGGAKKNHQNAKKYQERLKLQH